MTGHCVVVVVVVVVVVIVASTLSSSKHALLVMRTTRETRIVCFLSSFEHIGVVPVSLPSSGW